MQPGHERFPLFDGLRALAATLVFIFHTWVFIGLDRGRSLGRAVHDLGVEATRDISMVTGHLGETGVALFYLLSAFLLYRPFARHALAGGKPVELKAYAIRRVARIVPAYWLVITVIGLTDPGTHVFTLDGLLNQYLFLGIWNPEGLVKSSNYYIAAWTVQVEMAFYLFLPFWAAGMSFLRNRGFNALRTEMFGLLALGAVGIGWKVVAARHISGEAWFGSSFAVLPASIDVFAVGMALSIATLLPKAHGSQLARRVGSLHIGCWVGALGLYLLLCWVGDARGPFGGTPSANALGSGFIKIPIALLIMLPAIWATPNSGLVGKVLGSRAVVWIGTVSYGLYLWQVWVIRHLGGDWFGGGEALFHGNDLRLIVPEGLAAYAITLAIAAASWYLLERRVLDAGHRLSKRLQRAA